MHKLAHKGMLVWMLCGLIFGQGCVSVCKTDESASWTGDRIVTSRAVTGFLNSFESAVLAKESELILAHLAPYYLRQQHGNLLEGRTDQFIAEFFSGASSGESDFASIPLDQICSLELVELREVENGYKVIYRVWSLDVMLECQWHVVRIASPDGTGFGLVGAWG